MSHSDSTNTRHLGRAYRRLQWDVSLGLFDSIRSQKICKDIATCYPKEAEVLPDKSSRSVRKNIAIQPKDLELANSILRWVVWAERPLTLEELKIAIAIQPGYQSMSDLSRMAENDFESVLRLILGAIIKVQNDIVYLVHQSAKEFLRGFNSIKSERFSSLQSNESNLDITVRCLTYLSFDEFDNPELLKQPERQPIEGYPLFYYSSSYWSDHIKQLNDEVQRAPRVKSTFLNLGHNKKKIQNATGLATFQTC
jgi:hypothetical protein